MYNKADYNKAENNSRYQDDLQLAELECQALTDEAREEGTMESSIIRPNRPSAGRTSLSYNNATAIPTTKFTAGPSATGAGKTALSKASLFVDTPTPSPPASRVSGAIGASKLGFASRFSPYEAKRALLTPTGAGGFNILRPIETCIDRLSPTPTRFPRKLYGSSGFVSGVSGSSSGLNGGTKTVPVLTSALRHQSSRDHRDRYNSSTRGHVTFSMANDNTRAAFRTSFGDAGGSFAARRPQRSLTSPAELRLLAVHDGRSMAYRSESEDVGGLYSRKNEYLLL